MMKRKITLKIAFLMILVTGMLPLWSIGQRSDESIRVKVQRSEDGHMTQIEEDVPAAEGEDLENLLKKYGVEEELGEIKPGEEVEITIRRKNKEASDDMVIELDRNKKKDNKLPERKTVSRAFLGVHYEMVYGKAVGSHINTVVRDTPAERAGLLPKDIITAADGERLSVLEDLARIVQRHKPGDRLMLSVVRGGKLKKIPVILGERKEHFFSPGNGDTGFNYELDFDRLAPGMKLNASAARPFLGVTFMRTESNIFINGEEVHRTNSSDHDLAVAEVLPHSTAREMGLRSGDRIVGLNGEKVATFSALTDVLRDYKVGDQVLVEFERDGQLAVASGTLKGRPEDLGRHLERNSYGPHGPHHRHSAREKVEMNGSIHDRVRTMMRHMEMEQEGGTTVREFSIVIRMDKVSEQEAQSLTRKSGQEFVAQGGLEVRRLEVAPNPNNGRFSVQFALPNGGEADMRVVDATGRVVYAETLRAQNGRYRKDFDISDRAKGIYYMQITQNGQAFSRKIVTQ